jgi:hypothetical protein
MRILLTPLPASVNLGRSDDLAKVVVAAGSREPAPLGPGSLHS